MCSLAEKYTSDTHSVHTGLLLPLLQRRQDVATPSPEEARCSYPSPRGGKTWLLLPQRRQDVAIKYRLRMYRQGSSGLGMDNKVCSVIHGWGTINGLRRHLQCLLVQLTVMAEHILMCSCMPGMITNHNFNMTSHATWHALPLWNQSEMWYIWTA